MLSNKTPLVSQRPWLLAARVAVADEARKHVAADALALPRAARARGGDGPIGFPGGVFAGEGIARAAQQPGMDVRGVPPRGRPV